MGMGNIPRVGNDCFLLCFFIIEKFWTQDPLHHSFHCCSTKIGWYKNIPSLLSFNFTTSVIHLPGCQLLLCSQLGGRAVKFPPPHLQLCLVDMGEATTPVLPPQSLAFPLELGEQWLLHPTTALPALWRGGVVTSTHLSSVVCLGVQWKLTLLSVSLPAGQGGIVTTTLFFCPPAHTMAGCTAVTVDPAHLPGFTASMSRPGVPLIGLCEFVWTWHSSLQPLCSSWAWCRSHMLLFHFCVLS